MGKFLHHAKLGSGGGQGHGWAEEPLASLPEVRAGVVLRGGVLSPNAELPETLAALCRAGLSPWALRACP